MFSALTSKGDREMTFPSLAWLAAVGEAVGLDGAGVGAGAVWAQENETAVSAQACARISRRRGVRYPW